MPGYHPNHHLFWPIIVMLITVAALWIFRHDLTDSASINAGRQARGECRGIADPRCD